LNKLGVIKIFNTQKKKKKTVQMDKLTGKFKINKNIKKIEKIEKNIEKKVEKIEKSDKVKKKQQLIFISKKDEKDEISITLNFISKDSTIGKIEKKLEEKFNYYVKLLNSKRELIKIERKKNEEFLKRIELSLKENQEYFNKNKIELEKLHENNLENLERIELDNILFKNNYNIENKSLYENIVEDKNINWDELKFEFNNLNELSENSHSKDLNDENNFSSINDLKLPDILNFNK
jgi:hypothetical protein